jgi:hypothetical protein
MSTNETWVYGDDVTVPEFPSETDRLEPATVSINGIQFSVDLKEYRHRSVKALRDTIATSNQADDSLYTNDGGWTRYGASWHHGANGDVHDFGQEFDAFQFAKSSGVDVWTPYELSLLPTFMTETGTLFLADDIVVAPNGYTYVVSVAAGFVRMGTPGQGTPWVNCTSAATPRCIEQFGRQLFIGCNGKIQKMDFNTSATVFSDFCTSPAKDYQLIRMAGSRLFAFEVLGGMYEISSGGTATLVFQPPGSAAAPFRWTCCFSLGSRIYAGGNDGETSRLWSFEVDSTGTLYRGGEVADFALGEKLNGAATTVGVAVLFTSQGVRLARPAGDGTLEYGPLVGVLQDGQHRSYSTGAIAGGRWVLGVNKDPITGEDCLVRFDLSTFTAPLAPAWSYDAVMRNGMAVQPAGNYGQHQIGVWQGGDGSPARYLALVGTTRALGYTADKPRWAQGGGTVVNIPLDEYGELESALVTFGTVEPKRLHFAQVTSDDLADGHVVGLSLVDEAGGHVASGEAFRTDDANVAGFTMDALDVVVEKLTVTVQLRGTTTASPTVRRWRLRALPIIPPVEEWILPLLMRSTTVSGNGPGGRRALSVADSLDTIRDLWRSKEAVDLVIGTSTYRARIEDFELVQGLWESGNVIGGHLVVRLVSV